MDGFLPEMATVPKSVSKRAMSSTVAPWISTLELETYRIGFILLINEEEEKDTAIKS